MNKGDELYDVPTYSTKFLKYDPSWHWIEGVSTSSWKTTQSSEGLGCT
jgi:hypothetical protein